jgi:hypothetical protein
MGFRSDVVRELVGTAGSSSRELYQPIRVGRGPGGYPAVVFIMWVGRRTVPINQRFKLFPIRLASSSLFAKPVLLGDGGLAEMNDNWMVPVFVSACGIAIE